MTKGGGTGKPKAYARFSASNGGAVRLLPPNALTCKEGLIIQKSRPLLLVQSYPANCVEFVCIEDLGLVEAQDSYETICAALVTSSVRRVLGARLDD